MGCKGGRFGAKNKKASCGGSVLMINMWGGGLYSGRGDLVEVEYAGVRWWGCQINLCVRGEHVGLEIKN